MKRIMRYLVLVAFPILFSLTSMVKPFPREQACLLYFKTWNFLKYYHPELVSSRKNADSFFMVTLPRVLQATTVQSFNGLIKEMLGQYKPTGTSITSAVDKGDLLINNLDLS